MLRKLTAAFAAASLRTRVLVTICLVVAAALVVMGTAGTILLRGYLINRADGQLHVFATDAGRYHPPPATPKRPRHGDPELPSAFLVEVVSGSGHVDRVLRAPLGGQDPGPVLQVPASRLKATDSPFSVQSGSHTWRVLVSPRTGGQFTVVGVSLDNVQPVVSRLTLIEFLTALAALALLVVIGARLVSGSLRPLDDIGRTAESIAGGDLSRRVPGYRPSTEVGRLSAALNTMLGHIETAYRAREEGEAKAQDSQERMRQFVADASHELRTPLTSIRGFADFYAQRGKDVDQETTERLMNRIRQEAARMTTLVDDMLLLARVDEPRELDPAPVDLSSLAADAVHDFRALHQDRSLTLDVAPEPVVIRADEAKIRQVIGNLLSNAMRHTPDGTPVRVAVHGDGPRAHLSVTDEGPGMTADQAARAFERFYRADPSRARASGGAGLGLSIVAALVKAHGGRADVSTEPGPGCVFHVWLPLAAANPEEST
ncbi:MAG TPA: HAMP domain-containing sensor histidine kinase [Streptosporangiaceae bacterium]